MNTRPGHVREGMTVIEPGPGMGFFTLELAHRVGGAGRVIAVTPSLFDAELQAARDAGFTPLERPLLRCNRAALLQRIEH